MDRVFYILAREEGSSGDFHYVKYGWDRYKSNSKNNSKLVV